MIRQLGPPNFFLTFTSVEQNCNGLTNTLQQLYNTHQSSQQKKPDITKDLDTYELIRKDPITFVRYYRHRINALKKMILADPSFFGNITDYFSVIEF